MENKKKQVILVATHIFLNRGILPVKMTDIANECGIGVASLYRYFSNKKNIVIEVATHLWYDLEPLVINLLDVQEFNSKNGYEQLYIMGNIYIDLYINNPNLLTFINEFDLFIISENITKDELVEYEKSVVSFYKYFDKAIQKGQKEKVIRDNINTDIFYLTATHTLLLLCQKLAKPNILISDDKDKNKEEIKLLIDALLAYAKI